MENHIKQNQLQTMSSDPVLDSISTFDVSKLIKIGVGVAVVGVIVYFVYRKLKTLEAQSEELVLHLNSLGSTVKMHHDLLRRIAGTPSNNFNNGEQGYPPTHETLVPKARRDLDRTSFDRPGLGLAQSFLERRYDPMRSPIPKENPIPQPPPTGEQKEDLRADTPSSNLTDAELDKLLDQELDLYPAQSETPKKEEPKYKVTPKERPTLEKKAKRTSLPVDTIEIETISPPVKKNDHPSRDGKRAKPFRNSGTESKNKDSSFRRSAREENS